ncbi:MAG: DUF1697 domain-containing protein [Flammeovirgaceae bacterium]
MKEKYIAFLRGINVGGHHKVPMATLRKEMEHLDCEQVVTILNTGNILFDAVITDLAVFEEKIAAHLAQVFGFPIPTILMKAKKLQALFDAAPFKHIEVTKEIRLYVSFLWKEVNIDLSLPWKSEDGAYQILTKEGKVITSVLDLSVSKTTKAMDALERFYGKGITTRNWNTLKRIEKKLS